MRYTIKPSWTKTSSVAKGYININVVNKTEYDQNHDQSADNNSKIIKSNKINSLVKDIA